ncbi:hypothetical protein Zmor_014395 [Zophobas morio]|uniref:Uncharacterized protein n=1 Tax=Zophobas morio TaxID=2755281 RepID=A0AA38IKP0_9CUCU|nr:hypothetical protein Zmor_014395 [Zophobas morio]
MYTRQNSKNTTNNLKTSGGCDVLPNMDEITKLVSEIIKKEVNVLLTRIDKLEAQVKTLSDTNAELVALLRESSGNDIAQNQRPREKVDESGSDLELSSLSDSNNLDNTFIEVKKDVSKTVPKKKRQNRTTSNKKQGVIRGTGVSDGNTSSEGNNHFGAPQKKIWLHIGRCRPTTTIEQVSLHLRKEWTNQVFEIIELESKGTNKSFRVSVNYEEELLKQLFDPNKWPVGVVIKRYRFFRNKAGSF